MRPDEEALRRGAFDRVATRVTEGGQIDLFRAPEGPGIEARIVLTRGGQDEVSCRSPHLCTDKGWPIELVDEDRQVAAPGFGGLGAREREGPLAALRE